MPQFEWIYSGLSHNVNDGGADLRSSHWVNNYPPPSEDGHWYILKGDRYVYTYSHNFVYWIKVSVDTTDTISSDFPESICFDGSYWWVLYRRTTEYGYDRVYKFNYNPATGQWWYMNTYEDLPLSNHAVDICWDGSYWWVLTRDPNYVIKFDSDWNQISSKAPEAIETPQSIHWDGLRWWVIDSYYDRVNKYSSDWGFSTYYYVNTEDNYPVDIFWCGGEWWLLGNQNKKVYRYRGVSALLVSTWKNIDSIKIKVGDDWKDVDVEQIKIIENGVWRDVFIKIT